MDRKIDQWNKTDSPEPDWHVYCHLIYDKGNTVVQWWRENQINGVGQLGIHIEGKVLWLYLTLYTIIILDELLI